MTSMKADLFRHKIPSAAEIRLLKEAVAEIGQIR